MKEGCGMWCKCASSASTYLFYAVPTEYIHVVLLILTVADLYMKIVKTCGAFEVRTTTCMSTSV